MLSEQRLGKCGVTNLLPSVRKPNHRNNSVCVIDTTEVCVLVSVEGLVHFYFVIHTHKNRHSRYKWCLTVDGLPSDVLELDVQKPTTESNNHTETSR